MRQLRYSYDIRQCLRVNRFPKLLIGGFVSNVSVPEACGCSAHTACLRAGLILQNVRILYWLYLSASPDAVVDQPQPPQPPEEAGSTLFCTLLMLGER